MIGLRALQNDFKLKIMLNDIVDSWWCAFHATETVSVVCWCCARNWVIVWEIDQSGYGLAMVSSRKRNRSRRLVHDDIIKKWFMCVVCPRLLSCPSHSHPAIIDLSTFNSVCLELLIGLDVAINAIHTRCAIQAESEKGHFYSFIFTKPQTLSAGNLLWLVWNTQASPTIVMWHISPHTSSGRHRKLLDFLLSSNRKLITEPETSKIIFYLFALCCAETEAEAGEGKEEDEYCHAILPPSAHRWDADGIAGRLKTIAFKINNLHFLFVSGMQFKYMTFS